MPKNSNRGGRNNNPSGRNQYSNWGVMELARERPIAAAATAVGAAAAGLFLWSRRAQITDQLSSLSDQIGEWTEGMGSGGGSSWSSGDDTAGLTTSGSTGSSGTSSSRGGRGRGSGSARGMSETGGGNSSLGARSGGGGATGAASGRARSQQSPTT